MIPGATAPPGGFAWIRSLVLALLLVVAATPIAAQQGTVQGHVRDDEGAAVRGVIVTVLRDSAVVAGSDTDDLGSGATMARSLARWSPWAIALAVPAFALLNVLRDAGLVEDRRDGWNIFYRVVEPRIFTILDTANEIAGTASSGQGSKQPAYSRNRRPRPESCPCPKCNPVNRNKC